MNDVPVKVIKENKYIVAFSDKTDKENYRPLSTLLTLSKVYGSLICKSQAAP